MGKKTCIIYDSWGTMFKSLPKEHAGELIQAICAYAFEETEPVIENPVLAAAFCMVKSKMDEDSQAYDEEIKRRSEAGKKGMSKRWNNKPITKDNSVITDNNSVITNDNTVITEDNTDKQSITNITDYVSVYVSDNNNNNIHSDKNIGVREKHKKSFTPPTVEEVRTYCRERNNNVDPDRFVDFYSSKGWMVGKNPMKDWKACVRTWERGSTQPVARSGTKPPDFPQRDYNFDELERQLIRNG